MQDFAKDSDVKSRKANGFLLLERHNLRWFLLPTSAEFIATKMTQFSEILPMHNVVPILPSEFRIRRRYADFTSHHFGMRLLINFRIFEYYVRISFENIQNKVYQDSTMLKLYGLKTRVFLSNACRLYFIVCLRFPEHGRY